MDTLREFLSAVSGRHGSAASAPGGGPGALGAGSAESSPDGEEPVLVRLRKLLQTGNPAVDMLTALMIPFTLHLLLRSTDYVYDWWEDFVEWMQNKVKGESYSREIVHESYRDDWWDETGREKLNHVLHKAITLYLDAHCDQLLDKAKFLKMDLLAKRELQERPYWDSGSDSDSEDDGDGEKDEQAEAAKKSGLGQLEKYKLTRAVPDECVVEIEKDLTLEVIHSEEALSAISSMRVERTTFWLSCRGSGAPQRVEGFVRKAFSWYCAELEGSVDTNRYMYVMQRDKVGKGKGKGEAQRVYKRFALSDEKRFGSLFFERKDELLGLLENFLQKRGSYAVKGYPHKLGLLLHGPPGTGKTSLIKALAQHTQRSIVSISLSCIETNQELMDAVFDQRYLVKGMDVPVRLTFKQVIYIFEDVDAASTVVHKRADGEVDGRGAQVLAAARSAAAAARNAAGGGGGGKGEAAGNAAVGGGRSGGGGIAGTLSTGSQDPNTGNGAGGRAGSPIDLSTDSAAGKGVLSADFLASFDALDLAGLLNVLDGVVDTPGRLLVMTTNHPEKLDPALIRPGRIDKILHLGYVRSACAAAMIEHYFGAGAVQPVHREQLQRLLDGSGPGGPSEPRRAGRAPSSAQLGAAVAERCLEMTPAQLEQQCSEHESVGELLRALHVRREQCVD